MQILFCSNSFPGHAECLARLLASNPEHNVFFASSYGRRDFSISGVRRLLLNTAVERSLKGKGELLRQWLQPVLAGRAARNAFAQLENSGFTPDMILFAAGCGEGLFLHSVFANAFRVAYLDLDKLATEEGEEKDAVNGRVQGLALFHAHVAFAFGDSQYLPAYLRPVVRVLPQFVDTVFFSREHASPISLDGIRFSRDTELISFDMRGKNAQNWPLAPALAQILRLRPKCHLLLTGLAEFCPAYSALSELFQLFSGRVHAMTLSRLAQYRDMLASASVRILPDTKGNVRDMLEAMSCETLLAAHSVPNDRAVIPGKTMLIWPDSVDAQIRMLNAVLDNRQMAESMGREARKAILAEHDQQPIFSRHIEDLMAAYQIWRKV